MQTTISPRGQVITFYSYKGGTGRSMAVANVACLLSARMAKTSQRVLVMDWDLEAPGLHRYFSARCDLPEYHLQEGVIDYFRALRGLLQDSPAFYEQLLAQDGCRMLDERLPLERFLTPDVVAGVDFMRAGRFDAEYAKHVGSFDWIDFYDKYTGAIRTFRELLTEKFAYVLIDSRTGITDVSSICTALLPEKLVGVFVPNRQNIDGLSEIVKQAIAYRGRSDDFRPLSVFPLPSRIENAEQDLKKQWRRDYQNGFEQLFQREYEIDDINLTSYFDEVLLPHVSSYAYGESIAVLQERSDAISLSAAYQRFFDRLLTLDFPWESIDSVPAPVDATADAEVRAVAIRYDAYLGHLSSDARAVLQIERELAKLGVACFLPARDVVAGEDIVAGASAAMHQSKFILLFLGPSGVGPWQDQKQLSVLETMAKEGLKRIVPVLLPEAPAIETLRLPPFLRNLQWVDVGRESNQVAVQNLAWVITGNRPAPKVGLSTFQLPVGVRRVYALAGASLLAFVCVFIGWRLNRTSPAVTLPNSSKAAIPSAQPSTSNPVSILPMTGPMASVLGHDVKISVFVAETRDKAEAGKAASVLRSHGYGVSGPEVEQTGNSPHETTIRFYQYDHDTVATGNNLVKLLKSMGFVVRTEFDAEFINKPPAPPPGTYEFWIGTTSQSQAIGTVLASFSVNVPEGIFPAGREGDYNWIASNSGSWTENRGSDFANHFQFSIRDMRDGCNGGLYKKVGSPNEIVFIPDAECPAMVLKYSSGKGWRDVGQIKEPK